MCQNSGSGMQSAQIQKFVEHGMPQKIVKTVEQTMRRRAAEQNVLPVAFLDSDDKVLSGAGVDTAAPPCDSASNQRDSAPQLAQKVNTLRQCPFRNSAPLEVRQRQQPDVAKEKIATIGAEVVAASKASARVFNADISAYSKKSDNNNDNEKVYVDALAIVTQITKQCFDRLAITAKNMQSSKLYTLLTRTTQPAHAVAVGVLALVLLTLWPNIFDTRDPAAEAQKASANGGTASHNLAVLVYLGAFATHFGAQIWMTFVSGLSLYFSLPRHIFGQCQQILFPKYFAMNATLSVGMLILFIKYFLGNRSFAIWMQLVTLALSAFIELTVRLYLAPPMLRLMLEKYKIEDAVGSGDEVGTLVQGDLVQCPHYQRIHKAFRRIHMTVAIGNMTVLLATCLHLYFLASKIQLAS